MKGIILVILSLVLFSCGVDLPDNLLGPEESKNNTVIEYAPYTENINFEMPLNGRQGPFHVEGKTFEVQLSVNNEADWNEILWRVEFNKNKSTSYLYAGHGKTIIISPTVRKFRFLVSGPGNVWFTSIPNPTVWQAHGRYQNTYTVDSIEVIN